MASDPHTVIVTDCVAAPTKAGRDLLVPPFSDLTGIRCCAVQVSLHAPSELARWANAELYSRMRPIGECPHAPA